MSHGDIVGKTLRQSLAADIELRIAQVVGQPERIMARISDEGQHAGSAFGPYFSLIKQLDRLPEKRAVAQLRRISYQLVHAPCAAVDQRVVAERPAYGLLVPGDRLVAGEDIAFRAIRPPQSLVERRICGRWILHAVDRSYCRQQTAVDQQLAVDRSPRGDLRQHIRCIESCRVAQQTVEIGRDLFAAYLSLQGPALQALADDQYEITPWRSSLRQLRNSGYGVMRGYPAVDFRPRICAVAPSGIEQAIGHVAGNGIGRDAARAVIA